MKSVLRSLLCDMRRALSGIGFYISILLVVVIQMQAVMEEFLMPDGDIIYYLDLTLNTGKLQILMPAIGTICYAWVLQRDRETGYMIYEKYRIDHGDYYLSKMIACFFSACISVIAGMLLFIAILALKVPMISEVALINMDVYQEGLFGNLLGQEMYIPYVLSITCARGFIAGAWSLTGMAVSTISDEHATSLVAPFLIAYGIEILCKYAGIALTPGKLDIGCTNGYALLQNPLTGFLCVIGVFGCITTASILVIKKMEQRRYGYGA